MLFVVFSQVACDSFFCQNCVFCKSRGSDVAFSAEIVNFTNLLGTYTVITLYNAASICMCLQMV